MHLLVRYVMLSTFCFIAMGVVVSYRFLYLMHQFESIAFGSTAMCGRDTFWFWVISAVPFYCATWEQ